MNAEIRRQENLRVVSHFNQSWQHADEQRIQEEIVSVFKETHRLQDDFYIIIENGRGIEPHPEDKSKEKIIEFTANSDLEKREKEAWDLLINWADKSEEGTALWFSPSLKKVDRYFNGYPCNKVCFYEIAYTFEFPPRKVLLGTTILFDTSKTHCLEVAKTLEPQLKDEKNPEILRNKIFVCPENFDLINILEMVASTKGSKPITPSQEKIKYFIDAIKSGRDPYQIAIEMQQQGIIGDDSLSCLDSGFGMISNTRILDFTKRHEWQWVDGDCVRCGKKNTKVGPCKICRKCNDELDKHDLASAA